MKRGVQGMNRKTKIIFVISLVMAVLLFYGLISQSGHETKPAVEYKNESYGFTLSLSGEFNDSVKIIEENQVVYFVSKEIQEKQPDNIFGVTGRIEIFAKSEFSKEAMLESGDAYGLKYLGENNRYYFGWAHATDVQVPPGDKNLTERFRTLETEFAEMVKTFKTIDAPAPELKTDTGSYVGLADNNFFEVKISGVPDEKAYRVFMITDEVRGKFEGLNLQEGDQIKLQYIENEYGQNAVQEIDRIVAYKKISAEEAKEVIDSEDGVIILDVRTPEEYTEGYIKGAVNLPNEDIKDTPPALLPDKNAKILVYCRSGNRSQEASQKLIDMGYSQVYDFGGIIDWPYEIIIESV